MKNENAEQPAPVQQDQHEFPLRGILASELKCWHRLTEEEATNLLAFVKRAAPQPAQQEPFGYFKAEPFGWTDCAETDEGAVALYTTPQPAQRTWVGLTPEWYALWIRNNYQDYWNIATLCDEMTKAAHNIKENT